MKLQIGESACSEDKENTKKPNQVSFRSPERPRFSETSFVGRSPSRKSIHRLSRIERSVVQKSLKSIIMLRKPILFKNIAKKISCRVGQLMKGACTGNMNYIKKEQIAMINDLSYFSDFKNKETKWRRFAKLKLMNGASNFLKKSLSFLNCRFYFLRVLLEKLKSVKVFKPEDPFIIIWDSISATLSSLSILFVSISFCLNISMDTIFHSLGLPLLSQGMTVCLIFACSFFLAEIMINFNLAFYDTGELIERRGSIRKAYLKGGLIWDILSVVPFISQLIFFTEYASYESLLVFIKLKSVYRFLNNLQNLLAFNETQEAFYSFLYLFITIFFINHLTACSWCLISFKSIEYNQPNWTNLTRLNKGEENFWLNLYLKASYWSLTTIVTLGYGDIVPQNNMETSFCMLVMALGSIIFGFSINKIGAIMENINRRSRLLRKNLKMVNLYMKSMNVPYELQGRIRKYLEYSFQEEIRPDIQGENILMERLNPSLYIELKANTFTNYLNSIRLFSKNFKMDTIKSLTQYIKVSHCRPGELLCEKNKACNKLFIVNSGDVILELIKRPLKKKKLDGIKEVKIEHGGVFGEYSFFTEQPNSETYRSQGYSTVAYITREDFLSVIKENRHEYERFCEIRDRLLIQDFELLYNTCRSCAGSSHLTSMCPTFKYSPSRTNLIWKHVFSPFQNRKRFRRSSNKVYNALVHRNTIEDECLDLQSSHSAESPTFSVTNSIILDDNNKKIFIEQIPKDSEEKLSEEENGIPTESTVLKVPMQMMNAMQRINKKEEKLPIKQLEMPHRLQKKPSFKSYKSQHSDYLVVSTNQRDSSSGLLDCHTGKDKRLDRSPSTRSNIPEIPEEMDKQDFQKTEAGEEINKKEFFLFDIDTMSNFSGYFPEQNAELILSRYRKERSLKKKNRTKILNNDN